MAPTIHPKTKQPARVIREKPPMTPVQERLHRWSAFKSSRTGGVWRRDIQLLNRKLGQIQTKIQTLSAGGTGVLAANANVIQAYQGREVQIMNRLNRLNEYKTQVVRHGNFGPYPPQALNEAWMYN